MNEDSVTQHDAANILSTEEKIDLILEKMVRVEAMVEKVISEVKPTIDELMDSSLFKMLGMKKSK
jgi:signal transduction histidine kinase